MKTTYIRYIPEIIREVYLFKGFKISQIFLTEKELRISLKKTRKTGKCPDCGKNCRKVECSYERTIRDLDFVGRQTRITFFEYKIVCLCGYRGFEHLDVIDKYSFYTQRFEEWVALLCEKMSLKDVTQICKINWKTAKNIDKKYLKKQIQPLSLQNPKRIGVDEIAYEKGHKYITIVRDLDLNRVIWVGLNRKKETLDTFFSELGKEKSIEIKVAVMDMWDPFIASVKENCPNADIVFDKFHVVKKFGEVITALRAAEYRKTDTPEGKDILKGTKWLLLRNRSNLETDAKKELKQFHRSRSMTKDQRNLKQE